jgi:Flp pilus assembly protein TadB
MTNHLADRMRLSGFVGKTDGETIGKALGGRPERLATHDEADACRQGMIAATIVHFVRSSFKTMRQMSHDQERTRSTSRLKGGSLVMITLVFCFMSMVVVAILLGALTVTLGVVLLVVPIAAIARLAKPRRPPQ